MAITLTNRAMPLARVLGEQMVFARALSFRPSPPHIPSNPISVTYSFAGSHSIARGPKSITARAPLLRMDNEGPKDLSDPLSGLAGHLSGAMPLRLGPFDEMREVEAMLSRRLAHIDERLQFARNVRETYVPRNDVEGLLAELMSLMMLDSVNMLPTLLYAADAVLFRTLSAGAKADGWREAYRLIRAVLSDRAVGSIWEFQMFSSHGARFLMHRDDEASWGSVVKTVSSSKCRDEADQIIGSFLSQLITPQALERFKGRKATDVLEFRIFDLSDKAETYELIRRTMGEDDRTVAERLVGSMLSGPEMDDLRNNGRMDQLLKRLADHEVFALRRKLVVSDFLMRKFRELALSSDGRTVLLKMLNFADRYESYRWVRKMVMDILRPPEPDYS